MTPPAKFHDFKPGRCDWCDAEIPTKDNELPCSESHGHLQFFNDIGTRGARRNLCLDCFYKFIVFENQQPKIVWLKQGIEKLHQEAMKEKGHLQRCPFCRSKEEARTRERAKKEAPK